LPAIPTIKDAIRRLWSELERLEAEYEGLTDTDVREALAVVLNHYFVLGLSDSRGFPICYEMFTPEGDAAVARAVEEFLVAAGRCMDKSPIATGQARHDVLRDLRLTTNSGADCERYIGILEEPLAADPVWSGRFEPGDYED
jgi:hypothetical protein